MKYYKKELVSNRLALPSGKGVAFVKIDGTDTGVLATEDQGLIDELDKAVAAHRGGVVEIDVQTYEELKKNPRAKPSQIKSLNAQSIRQLLSPRVNPNGAQAAAEVKPSAPMEVPKGLVSVSTKRRLKELVPKEG